MNYVEDVKNRIFDDTISSPVRAGVYARVSTRNESQKDSCDNQIKSAYDFVSEHKNVIIQTPYVFVDNGKSGKSITGRPEYAKLMDAIENEEIDIIIVKTCSRLFRSTIDAQVFVQKLQIHQVCLLTLEDYKIWNFDDQNDVMMFAIKSVFDASLSKTQSNAGKKAQERRVKDKQLYPKDLVEGFMYDPNKISTSGHKGDVVINPKTSPVIVRIFEEYVYHSATPASIYKMLKKEGITFPHNRRDDETKESYTENRFLSEHTISNILHNDKYIGKFYIDQRESRFIAGQESIRSVRPKEEWTLVDRPDLQIIDTEVFELAQRIRETRNHIYDKSDKIVVQNRYQGTHMFAGKVFCPLCGKSYQFGYADRKNTIPVYKIKKHSDCFNPIRRIEENDLVEITKQALRQIMEQQSDALNRLESVLAATVNASQNNGDEIETLKKQLASKESQINNLMDTIASGGLNDSAKTKINNKLNNLTEEFDKLSKVICEKESLRLDDSYITDSLTNIKKAIEELRKFTSMDRERILNYVERIELPPNGDIEILLKSGQVIIAKQHNDVSSPNGNTVGKNGKQDAPY